MHSGVSLSTCGADIHTYFRSGVGACLPTHIINLKSRNDRNAHIIKEFKNRNEFEITIVEACENPIGAIGLWNSFVNIIKTVADNQNELVVICEDDHQFTTAYSKEALFNVIAEAKKYNADILIGGVSWFRDVLQISEHIFWTDKFSGTQFIIVFKKFYSQILNAFFEEGDALDFKIASLTSNKFFIHPFISTQKDFGYSDVTYINDVERRMKNSFEDSSFNIDVLKNVSLFYKNLKSNAVPDKMNENSEDVKIPTYIINLPDRVERRFHILQQFADKDEFEIKIIPACKHEIGALGLWLSIRKIIETAIKSDDDVIIICEDDHKFTTHYSKEYLFRNIKDAYQQGADFMYGGVGAFECAVPITQNRYWVHSCLSTQFLIIYRPFFQSILSLSFDEGIVADRVLSELAGNKMVLSPFISTQEDFGYSDVTLIHNENKQLVQEMFNSAAARFEKIRDAGSQYLKF